MNIKIFSLVAAMALSLSVHAADVAPAAQVELPAAEQFVSAPVTVMEAFKKAVACNVFVSRLPDAAQKSPQCAKLLFSVITVMKQLNAVADKNEPVNPETYALLVDCWKQYMHLKHSPAPTNVFL